MVTQAKKIDPRYSFSDFLQVRLIVISEQSASVVRTRAETDRIKDELYDRV